MSVPNATAPEIAAAGLVISRCLACGSTAFPAAEICAECLGEDLRATACAGEGRLYSYTRIHERNGAVRAVGYADLDDGVRVFGRLTSPDGLAFGMAVRANMQPDPDDPARALCVMRPAVTP